MFFHTFVVVLFCTFGLSSLGFFLRKHKRHIFSTDIMHREIARAFCFMVLEVVSRVKSESDSLGGIMCFINVMVSKKSHSNISHVLFTRFFYP